MEMQISADYSYIATALTLTLDLSNPKSIGCDKVSRTTTVPSLKSLRSAVFVLSC